MAGLNRAWQVVCRLMLGPDALPANATERAAGERSDERSNERSNAQSNAQSRQPATRTLWRWAKRVWERVRREMEDPQQRRERARRDALSQERRATRRSLVLLMKQMTPQQRREFREHRYFHVIGGGSGERYRIRVGTIANIDAMREDGTVKHRLCARPIDDVPVYDVMAAQLLHLQDPASEPHFLLQANVQPTLPDDRSAYRTAWAAERF